MNERVDYNKFSYTYEVDRHFARLQDGHGCLNVSVAFTHPRIINAVSIGLMDTVDTYLLGEELAEKAKQHYRVAGTRDISSLYGENIDKWIFDVLWVDTRFDKNSAHVMGVRRVAQGRFLVCDVLDRAKDLIKEMNADELHQHILKRYVPPGPLFLYAFYNKIRT